MKYMQFNDIEHGDILRIYTGHESGCRCGCRGHYYDPGTKGFTRALNKITKLNPTVKMLEPGDDINEALALVEPDEAVSTILCEPEAKESWLDYCLPGDRTITIYFKNA
jgi:hypothetical protein